MSESPKAAFVFPGQGSQKVGMGKDLYESSAPARRVIDDADKTLGISLSRLFFEGPEEELRQTINAQPALVIVSLAYYEAAKQATGEKAISNPLFLAGHSLGEYTALAVAGAIDYGTAVYLARERGRLMYEAGMKMPGAMAAVLGMGETALADVCRETGTWLANINCPGQLVISGEKENIERAIALAKTRGASRAIPLQVSGAFHSPLMKPAVEGLSKAISSVEFRDPVVPVVANTTARPLTNVFEIKQELLDQLTNPVQWQRSVENMIESGVDTFIEIGSGNVLTGLVKRINKNVRTLNISSSADLNNITGNAV